MSSTQEKQSIEDSLDELGFAHKPGSSKGRQYSSRFYHAELRDYILQLIDSAKREGAIEELRNLPSERHETSGWCDTGFFIDSEDRWERIKQLEQSEESI